MLASSKKSYYNKCIPKYYEILFHIYSKSEHVFDMTELSKGEIRNIHLTKNLFNRVRRTDGKSEFYAHLSNINTNFYKTINTKFILVKKCRNM